MPARRKKPTATKARKSPTSKGGAQIIAQRAAQLKRYAERDERIAARKRAREASLNQTGAIDRLEPRVAIELARTNTPEPTAGHSADEALPPTLQVFLQGEDLPRIPVEIPSFAPLPVNDLIVSDVES